MKNRLVFSLAALALVLGLWAITSMSSDQTEARAEEAPENLDLVEIILPATLGAKATMGQQIFQAKCSACHGSDGQGVNGNGPPLIHKIYEPSHHGDEAFFRAAQNGVMAHHWPFGNMPPVKGVTRADIAQVVDFIREVQRANGIN